MTLATYTTLLAPAQAQFKDKGSLFIAYAYPVNSTEDIKQRVAALREQHHKARHWCYAYRLGTDGNRFRANDDGEPAGSAGRPILGQIDSAGITNVLVVVVRYFGGTLLGVPGLIHAYKTATATALAQAQRLEKVICRCVQLRCHYADLSEILRLAKQHGAEILHQDLKLDCMLVAAVPVTVYEACVAAWRKNREVVVVDMDG